MIIFAVLIFLAGLYIYKGHNSEVLIWKGHNKNATKEELKNIGMWTMIASLVPFILAILGIIFNFE
jgi:hypothetical protein